MPPADKPVGRLAAGLVRRRRRGVLPAASFVEELDVVRTHPPHALQKGTHGRQALRCVQPERAVEQLRRDAVGCHDLLGDRLLQAANLQPKYRGDEHQHQHTDDQVDLDPQVHEFTSGSKRPLAA